MISLQIIGWSVHHLRKSLKGSDVINKRRETILSLVQNVFK